MSGEPSSVSGEKKGSVEREAKCDHLSRKRLSVNKEEALSTEMAIREEEKRRRK